MTESVQDRAKEEIASDLPELRQAIQELQRLGFRFVRGSLHWCPYQERSDHEFKEE